ncbi:MAG: AAA family ATPase [Candidatus Moeniiplasma glomeromycotorum]|nr:AAA family ATPase [Candidatus Moeniiplasma glomeromycotorum]MCE8167180.1 AAA family ATPase [Candidatus Moeniiplasma glomeromycotorum]MCE8168808.1 AAA family ATPase [Candidatus Moeniiplasma glomeromycotorum]
MENTKWEVAKTIKEFRNIKDINFKFIRGGITIIVGENNVGKTNLLDYIYEENHKWDRFEGNYEESWWEEEKRRVPDYREDISLLDLFLFKKTQGDFRFYPLIHHLNPVWKNKATEGNIIFSYKMYYFDLTASSSFLTEKGKEDFKIEKVKSRDCEIFYGRKNEERRHEHFFIESSTEKSSHIDPWIPDYQTEKGDFVRHEEKNIITYRGFNKDICHSLSKIGSGYLKYKTLESLIKTLKIQRQVEGENTRECFPKKFYTPILLIDEPEVFFHPSLTADLANLIKKAKESSITIILTTHSPAFLSQFVNELINDEVNLVITQRDKNGVNLAPPLYLQEIIEDYKSENNNQKSTKRRIIEGYEEFALKSSEEVKNSDFYKSKWKRLFNQETLRTFFSKNVLFVEGMTEYILFTIVLREELQKELKDVEIVPIFGKWHYVFFYELAKGLGLNYWFLLDDDRNLDEEEKPKDEKTKHERFWKKYGEEKTRKEKEGILHGSELFIDTSEINYNYFTDKTRQSVEKIAKSLEINGLQLGDLPKKYQNWEKKLNELNSKEKIVEFAKGMEREMDTRISWFRSDIETFLFGEKVESNKEYNIISRSKEIFINLRKTNSAKLNELRKIFSFLKK